MRIDKDIANKQINISILRGSDVIKPITVRRSDGTDLRFDDYIGPIKVEFFTWKLTIRVDETELDVQDDPRVANMRINGDVMSGLRVSTCEYRCTGVNIETGLSEVLFYGRINLVG